MHSPKIIDISRAITDGMAVYPDNPPVVLTADSEKPLTHIALGSHTATHVDAPSHARTEGPGMGVYPLEVFVGAARVIDCTHVSECIEVADIAGHNINKGDRILFKTTNSALTLDTFEEGFVALSGDAAEYLVDRDVALVGIDYLSIKKRGAADNRAHTALLDKHIPIVEGLDLSPVDAGEYTLVCLPLKMDELDGAPARAILVAQ